MITRTIPVFSLLFLWTGLVSAGAMTASDTVGTAAAYSTKGADTCTKCHDEDSVFPVYSIFKTKHAQPADARTPFAGSQCETCHGPGAEHAKFVQPGEHQAPINSFGKNSRLSVAQQNQVCLGCHRGGERMAWQGSAHESGAVACTGCHRIHAARDPMVTPASQAEACYPCHRKQRSEFLKPAAHPLRFGKMSCSDCHQVHGTSNDALLKHPNLNETCYDCHAEKRGPLLWEHAPVTENCDICHLPHGSIQPSLLRRRPPLLCQECHSQVGHTSVTRTAGSLPGASPSVFLLAGGCTNCHSQIHGSNHPSGSELMR